MKSTSYQSSMSFTMMSHGNRVLSIDMARGFALIVMVLCHFTVFYSTEAAADTFTIFFLEYLLAGWGAGAFLMMMGMSQVLSAQRTGGDDPTRFLIKALLRGGYLFAVGLIMLLLAMGPDKLWRWDILTLMGFATIILFFCRRLSLGMLVSLSLVIAVVTPYLRRMVDIAGEWGGAFAQVPYISKYLPGMFVEPVGDYLSAWEFGRIIKGFFLAGDFPVLPWILFPVIGLIIGHRIMHGKMRQDLPMFFTLGFFLLGIGVGLAYLGRSKPTDSVIGDLISPFCFYPDSFSMISAQVGMSIIAFSLFYFAFNVRRKEGTKQGSVTRFFVRTSYFALTFYFLHYLLMGWPLLAIYFATGRYPRMEGNYYNLMGVFPAFLCGIGVVALLGIVIFFWERKGAKYTLEWILAKLTGRFASGYQRRRE